MNKKFNVIKLSGIKGVFLILFLICCLVTGFLVFPGWAAMHVWNFAASYFDALPQMNIVHGVILWCIAALSFYALNRNNFGISFGSVPPSEARIRNIIKEESKEYMLSHNEKSSEDKDKIVK